MILRGRLDGPGGSIFMATVLGQSGSRSFVYAFAILGFFNVTPALAGGANQVSLSISGRNGQSNIVGSYLLSLAGDTTKEGGLVRAAVGGDEDDDSGGSRNVEVLVGYQHVEGDWRFRAFAGVAYVSTDDAEKYGLMVRLQAFTKRSADLYVNTTASYSSAKQDAQALVQVGGQIGNDLVLGPEFGLGLSDEYTRGRVGLFLTGIKLGDVSVSMRGGYTISERDSGSEGTYYYGTSFSYRF
jgi:hypothetical protein